MGRPLSGKNEYPYGKYGINVDAAVLPNGTQLTNLRILKQRSSIMYDLMSLDGENIYTFMSLTGYDKVGKPLQHTDDFAQLASIMPPGTFCISAIKHVHNTPSVLFVTKMERNRLNLNDGTIVYSPFFEIRDTNNIPVTNINVQPEIYELVLGDGLQLTYEILPSNASNKLVTWVSSDPDIAEVDGYGYVISKRVGSVEITCTSMSNSLIKSTITINNVLPPPTNIEIMPKYSEISIGNSIQLNYTILPENANNNEVSWTSSNEQVATVDIGGVVTAINVGTSNITVISNENENIFDTCTIQTKIPVKSIKLNNNTYSLGINQSFQLEYVITPSNATYKNVKWTSSDNNVITVSSTGEVVAVAVGTATIKVESIDDPSISDNCLVSVHIIYPSTIDVSPSNKTIKVGESVQFTATITPDEVSDKGVIWSVSPTTVAGITGGGMLTGKSVGVCTVTGKAVLNNNLTEKSTITVILK